MKDKAHIVERVELKINGMYQVWGSLHDRKFPSEAHQAELAADRQNKTPDLVTLQSTVL
jgi:hypothetical protein